MNLFMAGVPRDLNPTFSFWCKSFNSREISNCLQRSLKAPPNEMFKCLKHIDPSVQSYDSSGDRERYSVKCAICSVIGSNSDDSTNLFLFSRLF